MSSETPLDAGSLDPLAEHNLRMATFAKRAGLPGDWYNAIRTESPDDWTFTVKTAAAIEDAVGQLIVSTISPAPLAEFVLRRPHVERIRLLEQMGVISHGFCAGLRAIAKLRNAYAHKIGYATLTLDQMLAMRTNDQREILDGIVRGIYGQTEDLPAEAHLVLKVGLKTAVWLVMMNFLASSYSHLPEESAQRAQAINDFYGINSPPSATVPAGGA